MSAEECKGIQWPESLCTRDGISTHRYGIMMNLGSVIRLFEVYKTVQEASKAVKDAMKLSFARAFDLYVVDLHQYILVPFVVCSNKTDIQHADKRLAMIFDKARKDEIKQIATLENRIQADSKKKSTTAFDIYLERIERRAKDIANNIDASRNDTEKQIADEMRHMQKELKEDFVEMQSAAN